MSKRLTKKSDKLGYCLRNSRFRVNQCWNKLGQLEDIEDEIGIDLITLFKKLKEAKKLFEEVDAKMGKIYFKLYGEYWVLVKAELKCD